MSPNEDCHCPRVKHMHGTRNNYLKHACRCTPCTNDATRERDKIRRQTAYGRYQSPYVQAQPAREHINNLRAQGMGAEAIAKKANLPPNTIRRIIWGAPRINTPPSQKIKRETAGRILATQHELTPNHLIPALGTQRRIQALQWLGYNPALIADLTGLGHHSVYRILSNRYVQVSTADTLKDLFKRLQLIPNPEKSYGATVARNTARRNGWLPPLLWDEELIDLPAHKGHPMELAA